MASNTPPQQMHWRDRAIAVSEAISDGFEVVKAYGARLAEWILFFCLIANILEIFPLPEPFASMFGNIVLGVQSVTLDVAGFGLTSMGAHARRRGDEKAAKKASTMGWTLIILMIVTVALVTTSLIVPATKPFIDTIDKVLILARVIVTVFYGHIVHSLRVAGTEHDNRVSSLEDQVASLQKQMDAKQKEVSSVQSKLSTVQAQVSTLNEDLDTARRDLSSVQRKLEAEQQRASSLENELLNGQDGTSTLRRDLAEARVLAEGLQIRLDAKTRELAEMQGDLSSVIDLRRELNAARQASEALREQLDGKTRELEGVQMQLSTEQRTVSSLRRELSSAQSQRMSTGQGERASTGQRNGASGQTRKGDTGQEKIVQLDTRRKTKQYAIAVLELLKEDRTISGREIARRLGGSPTTANEWKGFFEKGGKLEEVFPDMQANQVVNE